MSDHERAERAFREGLRGAAEAEPFAPLDPDAVKPRSGWATRWPMVAVAASVVVVAAVMLPSFLAGPGPMMASVPESPAADQAGAQAQPRQAEATPEASGLTDPAPGFRWESYRDVVVQVPQSWGYGVAPGPDWCVDETLLPAEPYVDLDRGARAANAISCQGRLADSRQALHLSFTPKGAEEPWSSDSATWQQYRREVGGALLTVVARESDAELARQILDSARAVSGGLDHNGCPVVLAEPAEGGSLAGAESDPIAVCLYDNRDDTLLASAALTGSAATAAWEAILAAPAGGGPDGGADECRSDERGPVRIVLGIGSVGQATMRFTGCRGNGLADPGAEGGLRRITPELCRALVVPPVAVFSGVGPAAALCLGATRVP